MHQVVKRISAHLYKEFFCSGILLNISVYTLWPLVLFLFCSSILLPLLSSPANDNFTYKVIFFFKKYLRAFTEVGKKHSVPVFLFHPLVFASPKTDFDQVADQGDRCKVFCENQHIIFGVINFEWQKEQRHSLSVLIVSTCTCMYIFVKEDLRPSCTYKHPIRHVSCHKKYQW